MSRFPVVFQHDSKDCGPSSLQMVLQYHGISVPITTLRDYCDLSRDGVSLKGLKTAAELLGFEAWAARVDADSLENLPLPFICHWLQNHFVVVYKITAEKVFVADPEKGLCSYSRQSFLQHWLGFKTFGILEDNPEKLAKSGAVLVLTPPDTPPPLSPVTKPEPLVKIRPFLRRSWRKLVLVGVSFPVLLGITLALPLVTQHLVDNAVAAGDVGLVRLLLVGFLVLTISHQVISALRDILLIRLGAGLSLDIVSEYLTQMLRLRTGFFERRSLGDLVQRMQDYSRVERFLTQQSLPTLFSTLIFLAFSIMLANYSFVILLVVLGFAVLSVWWVWWLRGKRRQYDIQEFELQGLVQDHTIEILSAITDLKALNLTKQKAAFYSNVLRRRFEATLRVLRLEELQSVGAGLLAGVGDTIALYLAARLVIAGNISLGGFIAIMYILGQLRGPLARIVPFLQMTQDALISYQRMQALAEEESEPEPGLLDEALLALDSAPIRFEDVSFKYNVTHKKNVLSNLNFEIPPVGKTAIVGKSGSGKTTLFKLLSRFYEPSEGRIFFGEIDLAQTSAAAWRKRCSVVLQEGTIFNTSLIYNIVLTHGDYDQERLETAIRLANVDEFIDDLGYGLKTSIGKNGWQLSTGQKQRVLIARALYRQADYLLMDEATSALDSQNEAEITAHMNMYGHNRASVVISHRLSTIKDADQILVMERGRIVEQGRHDDLMAAKGSYAQLFAAQS